MTIISHNPTRRSTLLLGCAALGGAVLPRRTFAAELETQSLEQTRQAAVKEGEVLWYDNSYPAEQARIFFDVFEKKYPGVKVKMLDVSSSQRLARVMQESMAGGPTADIVADTAGPVTLLTKQGFVRSVDWKALGMETSPATTPNPEMVNSAVGVFLGVYNTQKVKAEEIPKSLEEMTDSKWKGRVGMWSRPNGILNLLPAWGEERTTDYIRKLAELSPRLYISPQAVTEAVGAGEIDVGLFIPYHQILPTLRKRAPIEMIFTDPVPLTMLYAFLPKFGRNPNAGKLFLHWLTSPEGFTAVESATGRGTPFVPTSRIAQLIDGRKFSVFDAATEVAQADHLTALEQRYSRMLQGR